jgi:hypothetical protein
MDTPMMKCGHSANGVHRKKDGTSQPACVICAGIHAGALEIATEKPDFTGRVAKCSYNNPRGKCKSEVPSSSELAFFESRPTEEFDRYYCGCFGWD